MTENRQYSGPGFVSVIFDIPFPISVPNGTYLVHDTKKEIACIELVLREGSRCFFRNRPITGPTSFEDLRKADYTQQRPRDDYSYLSNCILQDGTEKATLNTHTGVDGGYAECKYYSEVSVTFLVDDISIIGESHQVFYKVCEILNPFLDKYRLLTEDYRVTRVSLEKNFYVGTFHTSPLTAEEVQLTPRELFQKLQIPRIFYKRLGQGASNILRTNDYELLGPRNPLKGNALAIFKNFIQEKYEMPLSFELIMEALRYLQRLRDYRLAIVHAESAFEVCVSDCLLKLMIDSGMTEMQASSTIENDQDYWGIKNRVRRLDYWNNSYCTKNALSLNAFYATPLYTHWNSDLYQKRNSAVHAGAGAFSYEEASLAIGIAKQCIVYLESRIPGLSNRVQLNPSMSGFRQNAGEVMF